MTTKEEMRKLNRIKAVLAETGHTGKWLAEQHGKDPATVSKWCTNTSQPDLYTLQRISELVNVDMRILIHSTLLQSNWEKGLNFSYGEACRENTNNIGFWY